MRSETVFWQIKRCDKQTYVLLQKMMRPYKYTSIQPESPQRFLKKNSLIQHTGWYKRTEFPEKAPFKKAKKWSSKNSTCNYNESYDYNRQSRLVNKM